MNPASKKKIVLIIVFFTIFYYAIINAIYFVPLPYSVTNGSFSLTSTEDKIIHERWTRLVTVDIELKSGGPLLLIHTVISDDYTEEISTAGNYQFRFQTWRITLSTVGTHATNATGTYRITDHTSPLLPKPKHNYVATLEIYIQFVFIATVLLGGLFFIFIILSGFLIKLNEKGLFKKLNNNIE